MLHECGWGFIDLPDGWSAEADDYVISCFPSDGNGLLRIAASRAARDDLDIEAIRSVARALRPESDLAESSLGRFAGFTATTEGTNNHRQEWWLANGRLMLEITWIRPSSEPEHDGDVVDALKTLEPHPEA